MILTKSHQYLKHDNGEHGRNKTVRSLTGSGQALPTRAKLQRSQRRFSHTIGSAMPQNADVFKTLFDISMKKRQHADAIGALKNIAAIKPGDAAAQKQLGDFLYDQNGHGRGHGRIRRGAQGRSDAARFFSNGTARLS